MNRISMVIAGSLIGFFGLATISAAESRLPWLVVSLLCFTGIFIFDEARRIVSSWGNGAVFVLIYGLALKALLEATPEDFWRDMAGAVFLISFLFEQNSEPWWGRVLTRSTVTPAVFFFVIVLAQNIPVLAPEEGLYCALSAIATVTFMEVFNLFREKNEYNGAAFVSACRAAVGGLASVFYCATFLPGIARAAPFDQLLLYIPGLALLVALSSLLFKERINRYLLFTCTWSLFIFWAALSGDGDRFNAAVGALVAGVWSIMTTHHQLQSGDPKRFLLNLAGWGIPGSLMFSLFVYGLAPAGQTSAQVGAVLWLVSFFVYWSGLVLPDSDKAPRGALKWDWRGSFALAVTLLGGLCLAAVKIIPDLLPSLMGSVK